MSAIAVPRAWLHGPTARFVRHLAEMVVAMMVGMFALGVPLNAILVVGGYPDGLRPYPELAAFVMTIEMIIGMAAWMLYRHHPRRRVAEMSAVMVVPTLVVVSLCLFGALPHASASGLSDFGMYAAMLGFMVYRRSEYTMDHGAMRHSAAMHHPADPKTDLTS